ncbi:MAG: hypothetical protein CL526_00055 [Aequorivita sp.]|nr:hypothetical protein [Aequorivita sp.]
MLFTKADKEKAFADVISALNYFKENKDENGQVDSYIAYGNLYFKHQNSRKALHYDSLAINLAKKIGYQKGLAVATGNLGREFIISGNLNVGDSLLNVAIEKEERFNEIDNDRLAELYNRKNVICVKRGDFLEGLLAIEKGLEYAQNTSDDALQRNLLINHANMLSRLSRFDEAVEVHFKVLRLCEKNKDTTGLLKVYNNLGIAFKNAQEYDKAITYYKKSYALGKLLGNYKNMGLTTINMATVYNAKDSEKELDTIYTQGIKYFEKIPDLAGMAFAHHNFGNYLVINKKYKKADFHLEKAYQLRSEIGASLAAASSLAVLGKSALQQKKYKEAKEYLLAAEPIYNENGRQNARLKELYGYLKDLFIAEENFERALHYQSLELQLERTLFTENEKVLVLKTEADYNIEKRDMKLALERKKQQITNDRIIFGGSSVVFVILLLSLLLWQRRRQIKERHKAQLASLNQQHLLNLTKSLKVAEQEERKKVALKLHDETGSMLSIAILNLKQFKDNISGVEISATEKLEVTQNLLQDITENVRNISHSLMPISLEKYGLKKAIHTLVEAINTSEKLVVEEVIEGLDTTAEWSDEFCLTIYRIVQEVMNNIIKHSQASHVLLQLVELENAVTIYIEDNGKGLNKEEEQNGMGLKMLKSNVQYLNGTIEINGNPNRGTFVLVELPIEKK